MVPENVIVRIEESLGFGLKNKRVQIAGISYKPNVSDLRESPALTLIEMLKLRGAIVTWHDPVVNEHNFEMSTPISKEIDLGLIITPHENIDFSIWINAGTKVIDLSSNPEIHGWPKYL
jgi:UDP-N-acetyl-D-glucosamine dehydrogenase